MVEHGNRIAIRLVQNPPENQEMDVFFPRGVDVFFPRFKAKAGEEADIIEAMAGTRAQRQRARR